ncbi:hypothetical protein KQI82_03740 [Oscillibacter sp. MSJ-2]|uniref:DUF4358 domain-containing protein n=1 Tax=Dysosmobacter acutus TaxID=2841504 RepID=A0ABS6F6Y8_9FIRM|nr:hypothetical protein [Dysosmobacter acutus]MBU5626048.1 hypothetical protein [Dysosmobacter acutus]
MKKLFALLLSLSLMLSLAACGSDNSSSGSSGSSSGEGSSSSSDLPVSGGVIDVEDGGSDSSDAPENLPAGEDAGDVDNSPATDPAGDAKPVNPPASKPSGGNTSKPSGGGSSSSKPSGGSSSSGSASKPDGGASSGSSSSGSSSSSEESLSDLMGTILDGVETPNYSISELAGDSFPYMLFIDQPRGATAVSADAMIGSIAHSVVLMRLPDGSDAEGIAKQVKDNADPRKWICVEAEKTIVKTSGNLVLLVMSDTATADAIAANFDAL